MMIADSQPTSKDNHTITEWVLEESAVVAQEILQRRVGGALTSPVPSSNRTGGFPTSGSPTIVALY